MDPFKDPELRKAIKYGIDREQLLKALFNGYGAIGNDSPIPPSDPYFNKDLEQTKYDPDKAKFHLKKATGSTKITLSASDAAFNGAVDAALLFQANAKAAGLDFEVKKEPQDGFWTRLAEGPVLRVLLGRPPGGDPDVHHRLQVDGDLERDRLQGRAFDKLLAEAKKTVEDEKRAPMIKDLQKMVHDDGGAIIPAFKDWSMRPRPR